jgi:hypothetical protein
MSQEDRFEIAAGSVAGRAHVRSGRPNQDAYAFRSRGHCLVALVADGCGSGALPGERLRLGPFPGNAPPYLGYGLLGDGPRFAVHRALPAADLGAVLLGTDGAAELSGPLSRLSEDDRCFRNRDAIRRRLTLLDRESALEDDTTVVVIRRRGP